MAVAKNVYVTAKPYNVFFEDKIPKNISPSLRPGYIRLRERMRMTIAMNGVGPLGALRYGQLFPQGKKATQ